MIRASPPKLSCTEWELEDLLKASNVGAGDLFGHAVALSADGNTLAVGAWGEDGAPDAGEANDSFLEAGAVYIFTRQGIDWTQKARLKASHGRPGDAFGGRLALSADGQALVVGAFAEDTGGRYSGAAYVFARDGENWSQSAFLKASSPTSEALFGDAVAMRADGRMLAVGAPYESSIEPTSGAVYLFERRDDGSWSQVARVKAPNPGALDGFGAALAFGDDALIVGAPFEDSCSDPSENEHDSAGAVYVFDGAAQWAFSRYLKAFACESQARFGWAISFAAGTLIVGAPAFPAPGSLTFFDGPNYVKRGYQVLAPNSSQRDSFGSSVALSQNGITYAVGAPAAQTGFVHIFSDGGVRTLTDPVSAEWDGFGEVLSISADGKTVAVGVDGESSPSAARKGESNGLAPASGAVYVY